MPAAAVIPASVASIKVAAVKRLAVECQCRVLDGGRCLALPCRPYKPPGSSTEIVVWLPAPHGVGSDSSVTLSKSECSKQS